MKWGLLVLFVAGAIWTATFFINTNSKSITQYESHHPYFSSIERKTVLTGKIIPKDEIKIKPQVSGIIEEVFLEEGAAVKTGDLIATIKVVPNEQAIYQAKGRINNAKVALKYSKIEFERNKRLYEKEVISTQDFQSFELAYKRTKLELENAKNDYQIVLKGSIGGRSRGNTYIRSTVNGTLLEIPVKKGDQVIQSNNFNDGTTIAIIADLSQMIFEGKVDEGEVRKLKVGMPLVITLGAAQDEELGATLKFIAPKSAETSGAVQFKVKADVKVEDGFLIRAGYSANATLILDKKEEVLVVPEALLQFDNKTNVPYVEIEIEEQQFERKDIEIGISDGIIAEVISGLTVNDRIKQWNKTEPIKTGTNKRQRTTRESNLPE